MVIESLFVAYYLYFRLIKCYLINGVKRDLCNYYGNDSWAVYEFRDSIPEGKCYHHSIDIRF